MVEIYKTVTPDPTGAYIPLLGYRVTKVENINTATGVDLFTVTGKVLITMWTGEVTNAFDGAQPSDYKLRVKTDNVDLCAATDLHGAVVGYMWSLSIRASLTILTGSTYAVSTVKATDNIGIPMCNRIIGLAGGSCVLQSLRTAGNVGDSMTHNIWYQPLESGAGVA